MQKYNNHEKYSIRNSIVESSHLINKNSQQSSSYLHNKNTLQIQQLQVYK